MGSSLFVTGWAGLCEGPQLGSRALCFFQLSVSLCFSSQRDDMEAIPGYLSLHQTADIMALKWTPNQLMNGSVGDLDYEKR